MNNFFNFLILKNNLNRSPFISLKSNFIKNCYILNSFNNFIFNSKNLFLFKSKFKNFLKTTIKINNIIQYTGIYLSRPSQPSNSDVIIIYSEFINCNDNSANGGGAIYQNTNILNLKHSSFQKCRATGHGGAIHFIGTSILINSCCGFDCSSNGCGQFIRVALPNSIEPNQYNLSTSIYCSIPLLNKPCESTIIAYGQLILSNDNATLNYINGDSSGLAPDSFSTNYINDCTILSNTGKNALRLYRSTQYAKRINLVNNTNLENGGIVLISGNTFMEDCVFVNNKGILFSGGTILNLNKCYFSGSLGSIVSITINNCNTNINNYPTINLYHINTYLCNFLINTFKIKFKNNFLNIILINFIII